jgi:hypothetical protein
VFANRRVDADDPQFAEIAFANPSVAKRIRAGANQRLFDRPQQLAAPASVTLGPLEQTFFA